MLRRAGEWEWHSGSGSEELGQEMGSEAGCGTVQHGQGYKTAVMGWNFVWQLAQLGRSEQYNPAPCCVAAGGLAGWSTRPVAH